METRFASACCSWPPRTNSDTTGSHSGTKQLVAQAVVPPIRPATRAAGQGPGRRHRGRATPHGDPADGTLTRPGLQASGERPNPPPEAERRDEQGVGQRSKAILRGLVKPEPALRARTGQSSEPKVRSLRVVRGAHHIAKQRRRRGAQLPSPGEAVLEVRAAALEKEFEGELRPVCRLATQISHNQGGEMAGPSLDLAHPREGGVQDPTHINTVGDQVQEGLRLSGRLERTRVRLPLRGREAQGLRDLTRRVVDQARQEWGNDRQQLQSSGPPTEPSGRTDGRQRAKTIPSPSEGSAADRLRHRFVGSQRRPPRQLGHVKRV